jgi:hypothetical protein
VSWSSEDAIDRARDELARQAEALHPGWRFSHGLFGWTATREGHILSGSTMPGLLAQIASADRTRNTQNPAWEGPGE